MLGFLAEGFRPCASNVLTKVRHSVHHRDASGEAPFPMTTTIPMQAPKSLRDRRVGPIAHIPADETAQRGLCGAKLQGPVRSAHGKCVVCLDLATAGRFATR